MMSDQSAKTSSWFDEGMSASVLTKQAKRLETYLAAVADGVIEPSELKQQEAHVVKLMREIEPKLSPELHNQVTQLLLELTAYDLMQLMHSLQAARPRTVFRG